MVAHFDLDYYGGKGIKVTPIVKDGNANVEFVELWLDKDFESLTFNKFGCSENSITCTVY